MKWYEVSAGGLIDAAALVSGIIPGAGSILNLIPAFRAKRRETIQELTTALVTKLAAAGVDPLLFDSMVSNEINRRMKVQFGITFLIFTFFFTTVSYAIVVLDGIYKWGIAPGAITALIIETPLQFVGLLFIIARNLFPQPNNSSVNK